MADLDTNAATVWQPGVAVRDWKPTPRRKEDKMVNERDGSDKENATPKPVNRSHYFGACPECGDTDGYLNVGKNHWFVCDAHRTRWYIGSNLFSLSPDEGEAEWETNRALLEGYRDVVRLPMTDPDEENIQPPHDHPVERNLPRTKPEQDDDIPF